MKKYYLPIIALTFAAGAQAQTILDEGFETGNTGSSPQPITAGAGWTTVNSYKGSNQNYTWHNYYSDPTSKSGPTISGACCAAVDGPMSINPTDGGGPREEILLTPELDLNDTYQLQFTFKVSPANCNEKSRYDIQVRVVEGDNLAGAETIFSIQNEKMLRESGISGFPIEDWAPRTAKVDLSDFKGEKVKLAFVYKMFNESSNIVYLDDVSVKKFTPATGPVASLSLDRFAFPAMYIGEKIYSDVITLTNAGKDGLRITGIDCPAGVTTTLNPANVNLLAYQSVMFNIAYTASLTSPTTGQVVLHTTGGDVTIDITASKQVLPEGATLETFETFFPPAGWANSGWGWNTNAFEGDHCAYQAGDFSATWLRSPRLDLLDGGSISFTYYNSYDGETAPEYDIELQASYDGGTTWKKVWNSDYQNGLNQMLTETIQLQGGSDHSYVRWYYPAVESDDEGAFDHSAFFLDRVVLPKVFGSDGVPAVASDPTPKPGTTEVYPKGVVLSWAPAQFATGYKLFVGTTSACDELVNGQDLGAALTFSLPDLEAETRYMWKVVPYNSKGDATGVSTWVFTTQKDASIDTFPYEQNFTDNGDDIPLGWFSTPSSAYNRTWSINSLKKYENDGKSYGVACSIWLNAGDSNDMRTPDVNLPADKPMSISFIWGDEHPASLVVDPSGKVQKNNVVPNNGVSEMLFEIYADGEWTTLSTISEKHFDDGDHKYWINERHDLSAYAGKKVQFRWVHKSYSGKDEGGSVTHIVIEEAKGDYAAFNRSSWNAAKVNFEKAANSGETLTIFNQGSNELTVKSATFATPNFTTSLKAGDKLAAGSATTFSVEFNALQTAAKVEDALTVEFEGGHTATLPVEGEALPQGTFYFSFEPNPLDYVWNEEFTMIDADKAPGYSFSSYWIYYSADGQRCAFSVESDSKEHGMYGMMAPISGEHALVGSSGQAVNADNWIISRKLVASADSKFDFYARNWESLNSVLPEAKHCVSVLVSTAGNTDTKDFTPVLRATEMPYLEGSNWNHYEVDLSSYAGQSIYVALRHTTNSPSNLAFFDDFTFSGFTIDASGIENVDAEETAGIAEDARVDVYNINGALVASGIGPRTLDNLAKGFYVVKAEGSKAFSILK